MSDSKDLNAFLIAESRLHELMQEHMTWISKCLADGEHRSWTPTLAVLAKAAPEDEGAILLHVLDVPFNEHYEKHGALRGIGRTIYEAKKIPVAVILSSECWIQQRRPGTKASHCEPRHDPARQEAIQVSGMTLGNRLAAMTAALVERGAGDVMKLEAFRPIAKAERLSLIESFFLGFFEGPAARAGIKLPE